ncbi:UNVERIFIED_CONTAM: hypothetical protein H355_005101 [Colinus virginianus]|nr:hypothetical protein H355_005101 [Colinus virginianus]
MFDKVWNAWRCTPRRCGRGVTDAVITREEAERIRRYFGDKIHDIFTEEDFALYRDVRQRIQQKIAQVFGISSSSMYLTKPTFFSRINSTEAKTTHDEYWHPHIDKVTYGSFDYTSLLYLSDYAEDFGGGRFVFMDAGSNKTIEPQAGRSLGLPALRQADLCPWWAVWYSRTMCFVSGVILE